MQRYDLPAMARRAGLRRTVVFRPISPAVADDKAYEKVLRELLGGIAGEIERVVLPAAERARASLDFTGDSVEGLESAFAYVRGAIDHMKGIAATMVGRILGMSEWRHRRSFAASARRATGIDIRSIISGDDVADHMQLALSRNTNLINGLADDTVKAIQQVVSDAVMKGASHADLARQIADRFGMSQRRAKLIARDQMSKWTGDLNRIRQVQAGITRYRWRTAQDERVRAEHAALEGSVQRWDDPPAIGNPGEPINCRCVAIAMIEI